MAPRAPLQPTAAKCSSDDFVWLKNYRCCFLKSTTQQKQSWTRPKGLPGTRCVRSCSASQLAMNQHLVLGKDCFELPLIQKRQMEGQGCVQKDAKGRQGYPDREGMVCRRRNTMQGPRRGSLLSYWNETLVSGGNTGYCKRQSIGCHPRRVWFLPHQVFWGPSFNWPHFSLHLWKRSGSRLSSQPQLAPLNNSVSPHCSGSVPQTPDVPAVHALFSRAGGEATRLPALASQWLLPLCHCL